MVPPPPQARPPSSGRIKGRGGAHIRSSSFASHVSPRARGQEWGMLGTASALLSCPKTEAQNWVNEVAAAADVDDISGR